MDLISWGLDVLWQKQPVINARAETVEDKPTFKPLLNQRVLVPASAYFEWRKNGNKKIKTRIAKDAGSLFAMAGLRSGDRFVILTCSPANGIAHIHNRMPVVLTPALEQEWINPDATFEDLGPRLGPYQDSLAISEPPRAKFKQRDLFS
jgi:putative SOS response-associated peptidase YedK